MDVISTETLDRLASEYEPVKNLVIKLRDWQNSREILQWYEGHLLGYLDCLRHFEKISVADWFDAGRQARALESQWKVMP
jgi:hypothetical protein